MIFRFLLIIVLLLLLWRLLRQFMQQFARQRWSAPRQGSEHNDARAQERTASPGGMLSPYDVLGIARNASAQDIRAAYQNLVQQYHPDRVAGLGPELRALAEQKMKEINAAYAQLKSRHTH